MTVEGGPAVPEPDAHQPTADQPDIVITWAPGGTGAPTADRDSAVFEALDASGLAIIRTVADAPIGAEDTVVYQHRRTDPADTDGVFGDAPYLLAVRLYVPAPMRDGVREWLENEHIAQQLGVDGAYWYGGYEASSGRFAFLNLWGLRDPDVIETPEWAVARDSPWRVRLLPAFDEMDRAVYRRLSR